MTRYLIKLTYVENPLEIDTDEYQKGVALGCYYNWFRMFNEWEWIKKV